MSSNIDAQAVPPALACCCTVCVGIPCGIGFGIAVPAGIGAATGAIANATAGIIGAATGAVGGLVYAITSIIILSGAKCCFGNCTDSPCVNKTVMLVALIVSTIAAGYITFYLMPSLGYPVTLQEAFILGAPFALCQFLGILCAPTPQAQAQEQE